MFPEKLVLPANIAWFSGPPGSPVRPAALPRPARRPWRHSRPTGIDRAQLGSEFREHAEEDTGDVTTRRLIEQILAEEEEHADDIIKLLASNQLPLEYLAVSGVGAAMMVKTATTLANFGKWYT